MRTITPLFFIFLVVGLSGCGDEEAKSTPLTSNNGSPSQDTGPDAPGDAGGDDEDTTADASTDAEPDAPRPFQTGPACDNVNPVHCLLPWPSDRFRADGRLALQEDAMPVNLQGVRVDPADFARFDGFSAVTSIMTALDGPIDPAALADESKIDASLTGDSTTVLLDVETGERVPHFAELDGWPKTDPALATFYIRPAVRLRESARYIVAIRGLTQPDGAPIEPWPGFAALRDDTASALEGIEARRAHFGTIFEALGAAGVERGSLIEAWDFTTASDASSTAELVALRDDALARIDADAPGGCTVTSVIEDPEEPSIYRAVTGTFTVPYYLDGPQLTIGTRFARGDDGAVTYQGEREAAFEMIIPHSVKAQVESGEGPARLLIFGHGFLSSTDIALGWEVLRAFAERHRFVILATNIWGFSQKDLSSISSAVADFNLFPASLEQASHAVVNKVVMTRRFAAGCASLPEVQINDEAVYTTDTRYFLGVSNGAIVGTSFAAISPDLTKVAFQVGGVSFPFVGKRSVNLTILGAILAASYPDKIEQDLMLVASQSQWDIVEAGTYAAHLRERPLPGTTPKEVLYQVALNDPQVPNLASWWAARILHLPLITPSPVQPWGLTPTTEAAPSGLTVFDLGVDPIPPGSMPPEDYNGVHDGIREGAASQEQLHRFFSEGGLVEVVCDGVCDPE